MSNKEQKPPTLQGDDLKAVEALQSAYKSLKAELAKLIVGQDVVIDQLLTSIFARGHCLLIGVPGLAKTMMIRTLADALSLSFSRVQFTPDLMPSDITGTEVIQENQTTGERTFKFIPGPIFANVILADEINRTPPKTQAALLESMQEFQVTAGGKKYPLTPPFFVLATNLRAASAMAAEPPPAPVGAVPSARPKASEGTDPTATASAMASRGVGRWGACTSAEVVAMARTFSQRPRPRNCPHPAPDDPTC
jgi:MoxR-like ATPase